MSEDPQAYAISLDKVSKEYPAHGKNDAVTALREVTVHVRKGRSIAIRGDSGSGKSTLLNILGGLDVATSGNVVVDGWDLGAMSEAELTRYRAEAVGFVFQAYNLLPELTASENVQLPMEALDKPRPDRSARAQELLASVGMTPRARHKPGQLSGGEQQRVAIARALANDPTIILADEPTGNLDQRSRRAVIQLLRKVTVEFGTTVVVVTHDPSVAGSCEKEYRIREGKLRWLADHQPVDPSETDEDDDDD